MRKWTVGVLAGLLAGAGFLDGSAGEADVAWRKLAYLHGLKADAAGVYRTEVNLSRGDVRNIAPLKLTWPAAQGCVYSAEFNGKAYAVSVESGVCSFQVPNGAFKRDHNLVALGVTSGADAALTNADRVAVFGTVEAMPGPRLSRQDFFERRLDRRIPAFAEAARLSAAGDEAGAVRTFAGYVRAHLDIPAATKEGYRSPDPSQRGRIRSVAERVLAGTMEECGVSHTFAGGRIDWQFNPTWNGYREWVWHLSVLRFLDELVRQYVLDGNETYARAWVRYFGDFVRDELCPVKGGGGETSSWRSLETASRLYQYLVNDVYWLLKSPALTDDFLVTVFTSLWEHADRIRRAHSGSGNWFSNEMTALYCFTLQVPYFAETDEWRAYALGKVEQELEQQVYPDGQQVELSTGYHPGVISIFSRVPRMCAHTGVKPPDDVHAVLARMYEPYMAIMRPDRRIPALNDATIWPSRAFFERGLRDFPERTDFAWFAGKEGAEPPAWTSRALPYAGWVALRDSWDGDAVWGFMDCGPYGTGHQHEDKLNVLVCAFGRELVNEGGWYDYDTSENRRYILSTRSHNTVRFDGRDQATGSVYRWHAKTDCRKKADFLFATNAAVDWAEATFAGPYQGNPGKGLTHRRRLLLFKRAADLSPFLVVADRFSCADAKSHAYEQLWHLKGAEFADFSAQSFLADYGRGVRLAGVHSDSGAKFVDKRGQTEPELQGWDPGNWDKHNAKPIATPVVCGTFAGSRRVVTVLQPLRASDAAHRITSVEASTDSSARDFVLTLADGRKLRLDEDGDASVCAGDPVRETRVFVDGANVRDLRTLGTARTRPCESWTDFVSEGGKFENRWLTDASVGPGNFQVKARLSVSHLWFCDSSVRVGGGERELIVNLQGVNGMFAILGPFVKADPETGRVQEAKGLIRPDVPFDLCIERLGDQLSVSVDGKLLRRQWVSDGALGPVGIVPVRGRLHVMRLEVTANFLPFESGTALDVNTVCKVRPCAPLKARAKGFPLGPFTNLKDGSVLTVVGREAWVSADEGKTWAKHSIFRDGKYRTNPEHAAVCLKSGTVVVNFVNDGERHYSWDIQKKRPNPDNRMPTYSVRSTDNGKTWEDPVRIADDYSGCMRGLIQLKDGTLVSMVQRLNYEEGRNFTQPYWSDDEGKTWHGADVMDCGGEHGDHSGLIEATLVELKDGRVWTLLRSYHGFFYEAFSSDSGRTWSPIPPQKSKIASTGSPGLLERMSDGSLLLVHNAIPTEGYERREELFAAFSDDEGETWTDPVVIARCPGARVAYPYVLERRPGELWISAMQGHLKTTVRLDELRAACGCARTGQSASASTCVAVPR